MAQGHFCVLCRWLACGEVAIHMRAAFIASQVGFEVELKASLSGAGVDVELVSRVCLSDPACLLRGRFYK